VLPGFVDPHTHLVWAGDRAAEFEMRLEGKTYMEIMTAGGGIQSTVNATRAASNEELASQTKQRAQVIFALGTTTAEAKSGYGLEWTSELKQMEVLLELDRQGPLEIQPTFLAAHAIPASFGDRPDAYVQQICAQMLPDLKSWWSAHASKRPLPFVDVFCEKGAFSLEQTRLIFTSAQKLGFPLKVHADEFENLGGARLAIELGAVSADHLVKTSPEEARLFGSSGTVAVSLPLTPFGLNEVLFVKDGEITEAHIDPAPLGLAGGKPENVTVAGKDEALQVLKELLDGYGPLVMQHMLTLNLAVALHLLEDVSIEEGAMRASAMLLSGDAGRHFGITGHA